MQTVPHPYEVELVDAPDLPNAVRILAETRFAQVVERGFGSAEEVANAFRRYVAAQESAPEDLGPDDMATAARWYRISEDARQAGFRNLGELPGAHFEVRLRRGP
jgi:hypothetical protein